MKQSQEKQPETLRVFNLTSVWDFLNLPKEGRLQMKKLFREAYFQSAPVHFSYLLRPGHGEEACDAGYFAMVVDVVAHHYQPYHPEYTIPPMPNEVLKWLQEPYCYAKDWNLKAQKAFKEELPIYLKGRVHINA